jgi:hypothetical protein
LSVELREQAVERFKIDQSLQKFRFSAAKKQAEFFKITHGRSPRVTRDSVEEEAKRLSIAWSKRQRKTKVIGESFGVQLTDSSRKIKGHFECSRCYRTFRDQERYAKHTSTHYAGNGTSENAARMAEAGEGRGLERSSRVLSETEKEDLRYFINDAYY